MGRVDNLLLTQAEIVVLLLFEPIEEKLAAKESRADFIDSFLLGSGQGHFLHKLLIPEVVDKESLDHFYPRKFFQPDEGMGHPGNDGFNRDFERVVQRSMRPDERLHARIDIRLELLSHGACCYG